MNIVFAVALALVSSAHAAVFFNDTANRNVSKVNLTQNSFGGGHGGSFFFPGSPGFAKWSRGRNDDKDSGLPHGHQHTVRPPHGGTNCDFCAPSTTPGPDVPMSEIMKQSKLAWARYDNRKATPAPAKDGPSCVDHHSAKYCAKMREIHACLDAEVREECAKTCGVCTPPGITMSASEISTPTTPWPANFGLATRRVSH
ncbi:hypothetical protein AAVH_40728 [Aphelenchoides avenae]|nr:hypothetical protein AAVH_40728 [Aphelenchus avenae]